MKHLFITVSLFQLFPSLLFSQVLTLPNALDISLKNYQLIKARKSYADAANAAVITARRDGLPDITLAGQQEYGSLDGMNGLSSGLQGITTITNGPALPAQSWNSAFGSLYVSNISWNIFSFGLQRAHVVAAKGIYDQEEAGYEQEKFLLQIKVISGYFDLLGAQRLRFSMQANLARATDLAMTIHARTDNGLNPGVDSSIADAEVSRARLSLTDAINYEQTKASQLATVLGVTTQNFMLDSSYVNRLPEGMLQPLSNSHPVLFFLSRRIEASALQASYLKKTGMPRFSLFGVLQDRGSGFGDAYGPANPKDYTTNYYDGIRPTRANYLLGIGLTWNITDYSRSASKAKSQQFLSAALTSEYRQQQNDLANQSILADRQIANALSRYRETPVQLKAATDAYIQKMELYSNGLANISDVAQALYTLSRAQTDKDIAYNAVWQAVLFKAASTGDLSGFLSQL
jgi:outer membrane protein TolC